MDHIFNYVDTILQKRDGCLEEKLYLCRRITIISGCEGLYIHDLCSALLRFCPFRSDKFGCARHSIQGKLDDLLSLARTVRARDS